MKQCEIGVLPSSTTALGAFESAFITTPGPWMHALGSDSDLSPPQPASRTATHATAAAGHAIAIARIGDLWRIGGAHALRIRPPANLRSAHAAVLGRGPACASRTRGAHARRGARSPRDRR